MTLPNELHPGFFSAGGGADLGDTIEQSLRFSASNLDFQYVPSTTGDRRKWTWATWVKRGLIDSTCGLLGVSAGASDTQQTEIRFESNGFLSLRGYTTLFRQTKNRFRDPNAWYHIVVVLDIANSTANDRIKFYINGQKVTEWDSISNPGTTDEFAINYADNTRLGLRPNGSDPVQGLLAETYFLDGIAITDTGGVIDEFGRYNTDGVWVPKSYTGSFGPNNGYHLKYDSSGYNGSGGIGADHSGSGNNFTASNFDTADVALYSKDLFTESGTASPDFNSTDKTFASGGEAVNAFDGSSSNEAGTLYSPNTGTWVIWRPTTAIVAQTSVKVRTRYCESIYVNETDTGLNAPAAVGLPGTLVDLSSALSFPITITNIAVRGNSSGGGASEGRLTDIEIDGTILVDNTDTDVDFFDTPTSNYSTYNPLVVTTGATGTFSNANLGNSAGTNWYTAMPTVKLGETEKWYAEFDFKTNYHVSSAYGMIAINTRTADGGYSNRLNPGFGVGMSGDSGYKDGSLYVSGGQFAPDFRTTGGYMMWAYDAATRNVWIGKDGTWYNSGDPANGTNPTITLTAGNEYMLSISSYSSSVGFANFGQMPFLFTQPTGFKALQTNNLPEPTIKNAKEHFGILTYQGNGTSLTVTDTDAVPFTPDLVWIKKRRDNGGGTSVREHILIDSVRGKDGGYYWNLSSNDALAETSIDHVSAIGEGSITVHDITSGEVNANLNTYVAWCWKAGGAATANGNGSIASQVSANTKAGFSIVSYSGVAPSTGTVGHGLSSPPEFMIVRNRDDQEAFAVYHQGVDSTAPEDYWMRLDSNTDRTLSSTHWNDIAPGNSFFTVGTANATNGSGNAIIAYCWHSVEGYSKFGSYTGNGSDDGTFVYLGFRPAFLMVKRTNSTGHWMMIDTTRSLFNPANNRLHADLPDNEYTNAGPDILSNGFKMRNGNLIGNFTGGSYIYAAFAENPFGGENTPPATAR